MRIKLALFILSALIIFSNCAPSRYVKPLKKNEQALALSFGGPLIKFSGAPIPIPFTTIGYARGLSNRLTCFGNIHSTSALFGNFQSDIGVLYSIFSKEDKYGFTISPAIQTALNLRNATGFRLWPSMDLNAYMHIKNKPTFVYGGIGSWFELSNKKAHDQIQTNYMVPDLHLGIMLVKTKWQNQIELKYLAPGVPNLPGVVDYIGVSHKGSFGFYYSLIRKF